MHDPDPAHDPDQDHATDQGYEPDLDEHGHDINRPLDDEETAALHRLDTGQGWLDLRRKKHGKKEHPRNPPQLP